MPGSTHHCPPGILFSHKKGKIAFSFKKIAQIFAQSKKSPYLCTAIER